MKNKKFAVYVCAVFPMLFWGTSYIWSKTVFEYLNPLTTIFFRLIISSIFLIIFLFLLKKNQKIKPEHYKLFFLAALLEPFLYFICESLGLNKVSPVVSSTIIATIPLFAPFVGFFILKEKLNRWNIVGFIISFIGILTMLLNRNLELNASPVGVALLFGAVTVAIFYSVLLKKLTTLYNALTITTVLNTIGILYFLPLMLIMEQRQPSSFEDFNSYIIPLLSLGIFASSIAYVMWSYSVGKIGVAKSNIFANLIPVFTAIISYFLTGEIISIQKALGIFIVIAGLLLSQIHVSKKISTLKKIS